MAKRALQVVLVLIGLLFLFRFALAAMVLGGSFLAHGGPVSPHLDSEARFYGAIASGSTAFYFYAAWQVEKRLPIVVVLASAAFLGGLLRLVSIGLVGAPDAGIQTAIAIEMVAPLVALGLALAVSRGAKRGD